MVAVDLHLHTDFSRDGLMSLHRLIRACHRRGLGAVAVTDHNTIEGALRLAAMEDELAGLKVIVGEEIRSSDGEVIGLFLEKQIPRGLTVERTIGLVREQGGFVYLPHPCDRLRRSRIRPEKLASILPLCDILEVFNGRNVFDRDNREAAAFAREYGLLQAVGSDAHTAMEVGRCYLEMEPFEKADFLEKLGMARQVTARSPLVVHAVTKVMKALRKGGVPPKPPSPLSPT